jgi:hypothetical protein
LHVKTIDELVSKIIQDELYTFLRGSRNEQVAYIKDRFSCDVKNGWKPWSDFIEVFERRNLFAHGEKSYTERYARICKENGSSSKAGKIGEPISLDREYLVHASDTLDEFLILLIFSLWRKLSKSTTAQACAALNQCAYSAIASDRFLLANRVLSHCLDLENIKCDDKIYRMMIVNRANSLKLMGKQKEAKDQISKIDWSAASDDFKISVAAVRGDNDTVIALMDRVKSDDLVGKDGFRSWPVFREQRKLPEFRERFEAVFGEPLRESVVRNAAKPTDSRKAVPLKPRRTVQKTAAR